MKKSADDQTAETYTEEMKVAEAIFVQALISIQELFGIESFAYYALVAQALGHSLGCSDAALEKEENIAFESEDAQPFRKTFLLNMEDGYNKHRAFHERNDCVKKPKPKIV